MWTVIKYKINKFSIMKAFLKMLGEMFEFYIPKL